MGRARPRTRGSFYSADAGGEVHEQLLTPEALQERLPEGTVIPPNVLENLAQDLHPATNTDLIQQTAARYALAPSARTSTDTQPLAGARDPRRELGAGPGGTPAPGPLAAPPERLRCDSSAEGSWGASATTPGTVAEHE
jgi:hypothetical protein